MGTCCSSSEKPQITITPEQAPKPPQVTKLARNHPKLKSEDDGLLDPPISHNVRPFWKHGEWQAFYEDVRKQLDDVFSNNESIARRKGRRPEERKIKAMPGDGIAKQSNTSMPYPNPERYPPSKGEAEDCAAATRLRANQLADFHQPFVDSLKDRESKITKCLDESDRKPEDICRKAR